MRTSKYKAKVFERMDYVADGQIDTNVSDTDAFVTKTELRQKTKLFVIYKQVNLPTLMYADKIWVNIKRTIRQKEFPHGWDTLRDMVSPKRTLACLPCTEKSVQQ